MAAIARRKWSEIAAETRRRTGGISYTSPTDGVTFDLRIQHALWAAYQTIALTYHHHELEKEDLTLTLTATSNVFTLPTDCFEVVAMTLRHPTTDAPLGPVSPYSFSALRNEYVAGSGLPGRRARHNNRLFFNVKADLAYKVDLYYYRFPTAPDFASASQVPDTSWDVDEYIIEGALRIIMPTVGRPDLGKLSREQLSEWLAEQIRSSLQIPLEERERAETNRALGGSQG